MESRVKVLGHPAHTILIVFPLGLLTTAVAFDLIYLVTDAARWSEMAYYLIAAGLIGGAAAAIPGWIDFFAIPGGTRAKRVGLIHGVGNVVMLGLFVLSWLLRRDHIAMPPTEAIVAALGGVGLSGITGWLGGELVGRLGVGVDDGAHLDAPSSLSELPTGPGIGAVRHRYMGRERRRYPPPVYAGVDRRARAARR